MTSPKNILTLALLYNRALKEETRERAQRLNLADNLEVNNYHALGRYLYGARDCATDQGLKRIVSENTPLIRPLNFDLLCLDEAQDITPIIYRFIRKLIQDNQSIESLQYVVLGDPRQVSAVLIKAYVGNLWL